MLSKSQLKRMFLRVLYEIQYGKMKNYSHGIDNIVPQWMNEYWELKMTKEDIQRAYEAIQELKTSGLIVKDATQREEVFQVLTPKGVEFVEKQKDPDVHGLQLEAIIKNPQLLKKCLGAFNDDNYENAIFLAYKLVEETVRNKAELDSSYFGAKLINTALHPDKGKLMIPSCELQHEQEGIYNMFKGAIAFFKNPSSHRTVCYDDRLLTIKIIALADLLLQILSTAQQRS